MKVTTTILGEEEVVTQLRVDIPKGTRRGMQNALNATGLLVMSRAKWLLQKGPKTGRIYKRGSIVHQASAEGEAPATDTGELASSINYDVDEANVSVDISADAEYAAALEFGSPRRNLGKRPFMTRALREMVDKIMKLFKSSILKELP